MPYVVFINALTETPARLLGHELILDNAARGRNGLFDEVDVAMCVGDAKILYPKVLRNHPLNFNTSVVSCCS